MIQAVCFDLGGTLLQLQGEPFSARVARAVGLPLFVIRPVLIQHFYTRNRSCIEAVEDFCRHLSLPATPDLIAAIERRPPEPLLYPDSIDALRSLSPYRLAAISNATPWHVSHIAAIELAGFFEVQVHSFDAGFAKPDVGIFRVVEQRLGVQPGELVLVGDSAPDALGAIQAGWKAIQVLRNGEPPLSAADAALSSLEGLRQVIERL